MTDQAKIIIDTATEVVDYIPLADLYISALNPRESVSEDGIALLAESLTSCGLIQNLAGLRDETGKVGIVAGGRRLRALHIAVKDRPDLGMVPVRLAPDPQVAAEWASAENTAREALDPADEIRAYGKMADGGTPVAKIAQAFAVTEAHVRRRLALAHLPVPVLDALKAGEISLSGAKAMTISDDDKKILDVLERAKSAWLNEHSIRQMLRPGSVKADDRRAVFVGLDAYREAGGTTTTDLFEDETLLDDPELLDRLFSEKLETVTAQYAAEHGWHWAEAVEERFIGWHQIESRKLNRLYPEQGDLSAEEAERYDELAELANGEVLDAAGQVELDNLQIKLDGDYTDDQKAVSGVLIHVDHDGELQLTAGLVRKEDKTAAIEAGVLPKPRHGTGSGDTARSPISQKLAGDLARVARGARQHAALRDPDLILALLAFQLTGKSGDRRPFGLQEREVANQPTTETAGYALDARLTTPASLPKDPWGVDLARSFRAFKAKGMDHVMEELTRHLAALLSVSDDKLSGLIDKQVQTSIREVWTPTAGNFFSRVNGAYLDALWQELLGLAGDHPTVTTFARLKKAEKAAKLESLFADPEVQKAHHADEAAQARIAAWLPEGMA